MCCYIGDLVGLADLEHIADLITDMYRAKEYTLARAYVPQQDVADGIVEIVILEES